MTWRARISSKCVAPPVADHLLRAGRVQPGAAADPHLARPGNYADVLLGSMFDLKWVDGADDSLIDKDGVEGRKEPVRIYVQKAEDAA